MGLPGCLDMVMGWHFYFYDFVRSLYILNYYKIYCHNIIEKFPL